MKKIVLAILVIGAVAAGIVILNPVKKSSLITPNLQEAKKIQPSETFIDYTDPSGFSFSYPDNLSIIKNDPEGSSAYADLQLASKDVNGSLNLKIIDSKFKTLDEWIKFNEGTAKEVSLGNLKAMEVKTADRLLLGALDQGVFFSIEMPLIEEEFWMKAYNKVISSFSFVSQASAAAGPNDVTFEGEEVVE